MEHWHDDDPELLMMDSASKALGWIGGDAVVREIDARWWDAEDIEFRRWAACNLDHVGGELCEERCLDFFKPEEDHETKSLLAYSLLGNFFTEAIDLVWPFLAEADDLELEDVEEIGLRDRLVAVCTIMGRTFPKFEEWREQALEENWGWVGPVGWRVADNFPPPDSFVRKQSEN
jgi:hypothetical protein